MLLTEVGVPSLNASRQFVEWFGAGVLSQSQVLLAFGVVAELFNGVRDAEPLDGELLILCCDKPFLGFAPRRSIEAPYIGSKLHALAPCTMEHHPGQNADRQFCNFWYVCCMLRGRSALLVTFTCVRHSDES